MPITHLIHPVKNVSPDCNRDCRNRVQESTRLRQAQADSEYKRCTKNKKSQQFNLFFKQPCKRFIWLLCFEIKFYHTVLFDILHRFINRIGN